MFENGKTNLENQKAMFDCDNPTLLFDFRDLGCHFRSLCGEGRQSYRADPF